MKLELDHPYGGTCTIVGEFTAQEVMDWLIRSNYAPMYMCALQDGMRYTLTGGGMKILDIIEHKREILVYSLGNSGTQMCRVEVINR